MRGVIDEMLSDISVNTSMVDEIVVSDVRLICICFCCPIGESSDFGVADWRLSLCLHAWPTLLLKLFLKLFLKSRPEDSEF